MYIYWELDLNSMWQQNQAGYIQRGALNPPQKNKTKQEISQIEGKKCEKEKGNETEKIDWIGHNVVYKYM